MRLGYSIGLELDDPDDWHVLVNWRLVDGRAMPVGIEVHSSRTGHREGDEWPESDRPKPITRELFKRLLIGEVIEQGRAQVLAVWETMHQRDPAAPEVVRVREGLHDFADPSRSRADWKYRATAEVYADVKRAQARSLVGRKVAIETQKRLLARRDPRLQPSYGLVRKWIMEARRRGYIPPVDEPPQTPDGKERSGNPERKQPQ